MADLLTAAKQPAVGHLDGDRVYLHYTWWSAVSGVARMPYAAPDWLRKHSRLAGTPRRAVRKGCEPGFWHADRVNLWHRTPAEDKLAEIRRRFPSSAFAERLP